MSKKIALNGKYGTGKFAIVSDEDFEQLNKHKWYLAKAYKSRDYYQVTRERFGKKIPMGVQIINKKDGFYVDHINRNTLDNRRENLRHATPFENTHNRRNLTGRPDKFKYTTKLGNKWQSQVVVLGKKFKYLGLFDNREDAHRAGVNYLDKLRGEI